MSQQSSKVITRQWKIIQFLLNNSYVTTTDIEEHLYQLGLETALRTIQRDLNLLEKIFPLECRRDHMPHNWRWQKVETDVKGLNLSQAAILHLVNKELRDVLPQHILMELNPLFEKAELMMAHTAIKKQEILNRFQSNFHLGKGKTLPLVASSLINNINEIYRYTFNLDKKQAKPILQRLAMILESHDLPELAQALKGE